MTAAILRDLARVKAVFQLRAIETIIRGPASGIEARSDETPESGSAEGKSPAPKGDAQ